jgi:hypothetical protein
MRKRVRRSPRLRGLQAWRSVPYLGRERAGLLFGTLLDLLLLAALLLVGGLALRWVH